MPTSRSDRPIIGITAGDASGIGPEVVAKALARTGPAYFLIIADAHAFRRMLEDLGIALDFTAIDNPGDIDFIHHPITCLDMKNLSCEDVEYGKVSSHCGRAAAEYIKEAVRLAQEDKINAIVTAPINKEALRLAGFDWPGHTELLAALTHTKDYAMMLVGGPLRVVLVTTHLPLKKVGDAVTKPKVLQTIELTHRALKEYFGVPSPKIGVAGLNPHGGEAGTFGDEEAEKIAPALTSAKEAGIDAKGPIPADVLFYQAYKGAYDAVVCMYHDQGLAPLKMIAFEQGVNLTLGLPIIRTSPDHGTAFDIAGKGRANPGSMSKAIELAIELAKQRL